MENYLFEIYFTDETFTKEEQKNLDLKTILESLPNGKNKDLLLDVVKQVADKQKTIRNETINYDEAAPSFLEETLVETVSTIQLGALSKRDNVKLI